MIWKWEDLTRVETWHSSYAWRVRRCVKSWPSYYRVRAFHIVTKYNHRTCQDIISRQLRSSKWNEKFTLKIVCVSLSTLGQALQLLREDHEGTVTVFDHTTHLALLFNLKQYCECDIRPVVVPTNIIAKGWGLLDRGLMKAEHGATIICSSLAPVSRDSDRVLRPTATVLKLARQQDPEALKQEISKEVERVIQTNLKSDSSGNIQRGYVYIMQRGSAPEYLKIGFSSKSVTIRNDSLKNCFEDLRIIAETSNIPYAIKVERLVHTELMYFKRALDRGECGEQHSEWFEIDIRIAKAIVLRWSRWITAEPYDTGSGELKSKWRKPLLERKDDDKAENIATTVTRKIKPLLKPLGKEFSLNENSESVRDMKKKVQAVELTERKKSPWPDRTRSRKRRFDEC